MSCGTCGTAPCASRAPRPLHPQRRRRPRQAGHGAHRGEGRDPLRRPPGAAGPDARLGQRPQRQGIPRHAGPQADRRHLQRGRRGALPLEGLRPEPGRVPPLRGGRRRQRPAPLVHQVLRDDLRPPLAQARGGHVPPVRRLGALPAQRGAGGPRRPGLLAADVELLRRRARRADRWRTTPGACTTPWSRRASPSRWCTTACWTRPTSRRSRRSSCPTSPPSPTPSASSCATSSRAAAAWSPPTRPRSMTSGATRRADFGLADLFGVRYAGGIEGPMQNSYLAIGRDPVTRAFHPLVAGLEDAGRIINGVHRVKVETTTPLPYAPLTLIQSYPDLPMEMVWPRVPDSDDPQVYARQHGDGPRGLLPLGHRPHLLGGAVRGPRPAAGQRRALGHQRRAAGHRHRPRRAGCDRLGAEALDDRAPGQPDQPHDDEGPDPRADPGGRAGGAPAPAGRPGGGRREAAAGRRSTPEVRDEPGALTVRVPSVLDHEVVAVDFRA